ncbi:phosphate/phosphite/phosphonate ABC transporter substrate-binding protein [Bdellovibrio bacteriovorus]
MNRLILGLITLLVFSSAFAENIPAEEAPPAITIGVIPGGNPENVREQGLTLAKELQTRLNIPVNIYISKNYSGLIEAMKNKKVDYAFFSSATYVLAEEQAKAKVLLKKSWHEPYYWSVVITPKHSGIKNLKQLKGKRMAFVDDKSSSGYLYPWAEFKKLGIGEKDFKEMVFTGNHQASIQFLEAKKVDAAAVFSDDEKGEQGAWVKFGTDKKAKYRIIWQSPPIPNDPFAVRQDFYDLYPKTTHSLMFALIDLVQETRGKDTYTEILGSRDLMPATSKQYDPVREMVKALELKP